jgi:hypothetical protein
MHGQYQQFWPFDCQSLCGRMALRRRFVVAGWQAQPSAMSVMGELLKEAGGEAQAQLLTALHAGLANSDDWVMKVRWVRWYQHLAATVTSDPNPTSFHRYNTSPPP